MLTYGGLVALYLAYTGFAGRVYRPPTVAGSRSPRDLDGTFDLGICEEQGDEPTS